MKILNKILILIVTVFAISGCEGFLDEEPVSFLSKNQFYQTEDDAIAVINAAYDPFATNSYYGQNYWLQVEMKAEYCYGRGSHLSPGLYILDNSNIGRIAAIWEQAYLSINRAHAAMEKVPEMDIDENLKARIKSEAHFIRALNYYNLVRLWGGVPLITEEIDEISDFSFPRASVSDIYDLIVSDLEEAEKGLKKKSEQSSAGELFRATIGAAQTLAADVYLNLGDYTKAMEKADAVIQSGEYSLEPDIYEVYNVENQTTSEDVFSIKYSRIDGMGSPLPIYIHNANAGYSTNGYRTILGNPNSFLGTWDASDLRRDLNLYTLPQDSAFLTASEPILYKKFIDSLAIGGNMGNDFPVFRYVDALFIYAEADIRSDDVLSAQGLEYINMIRRRAYGRDIETPDAEVDFASGLTSDQYLEIIFDERGKEFMIESKRWFDMLRYDRVEELITTAKTDVTYSSTLLLWPIPQEEIDNNNGISSDDQNPGY